MPPNPWRSIPLSRFPWKTTVTTRWNDNDVYSHLNNAHYVSFMDSAINKWLIQNQLLLLPGAPPPPAGITVPDCIGICAENGVHYFSSLAYPQDVVCGVCVTHIGRVAATYRVGMYAAPAEGSTEEPKIAAIGKFVHVFTDRVTQRPLQHGLPLELQRAFATILVEEPKNPHPH